MFGILGKYTVKFGKDPIVLLGLILHFITYLLVYYNLPGESIIKDVSRNDSHGILFSPSK